MGSCLRDSAVISPAPSGFDDHPAELPGGPRGDRSRIGIYRELIQIRQPLVNFPPSLGVIGTCAPAAAISAAASTSLGGHEDPLYGAINVLSASSASITRSISSSLL